VTTQRISSEDVTPFLRDGPRPSFSRALWRIASADVSCGNVVTLLRDGPGTFDAMLALIDSAKETVDFEGYIFRRDEIGDRFVKAFVGAAERGVRVRVLVDWLGRLPTPWSYFRHMERDGLEVRPFNPPGFRARQVRRIRGEYAENPVAVGSRMIR
jgi:cardiolipin synthase